MRGLGRRKAWVDEAACLTVDPEVFFPDVGEGFRNRTKQAQKICASCPVKAECLQEALDHNHRDGVWGGLSETERKPLHKARRLR